MFEFTIAYANGNILTLKESNEAHAKGLKREFSNQVDIGLIKGFSLRQNGVIVFVCLFQKGSFPKVKSCKYLLTEQTI